MIKELKYFFFIFVIIIFFFFVLKYYFSDTNIKKSHRSVNLINDNIKQYEDNLLILNSDTESTSDKTPEGPEEKLQKLAEMKEKGLINEDDYNNKKEEILKVM